MSDTVSLLGLRAYGYHGVLDFEREQGQDFIVDVEMQVDTRPAAATDDLSLTVDYGQVAAEVVAIITGSPVDLIETLAERIAARVLQFDGVEGVSIAVHKPQAPVGQEFSDVIVRITR